MQVFAVVALAAAAAVSAQSPTYKQEPAPGYTDAYVPGTGNGVDCHYDQYPQEPVAPKYVEDHHAGYYYVNTPASPKATQPAVYKKYDNSAPAPKESPAAKDAYTSKDAPADKDAYKSKDAAAKDDKYKEAESPILSSAQSTRVSVVGVVAAVLAALAL
ncbi:hypothetical protein BC831DRAFT_448632 [Entophlyctis helioformis]|nr:hypothetical protein BC831DRAFT_448589 [Entophlyctis helioformis]KAI8928419.1 hypothetical protein BC831DRAFT_448632 [Entophlyctis helioformis]